MGVFTKSLLVLLVAISMPLLYRQLANENTIKFMSSYYSNYKSIDSFLRQSAYHIDSASSRVKLEVNNLAIKVQEQIKAYAESKTADTKEKVSSTDKRADQKKDEAGQATPRLTSCPGENEQVRLWTPSELAKYDGNSGESDIYIAFLGSVYNVTVSAQHYGPGSEYSAFAGRDATRAFVTGNFTHDLVDDVTGIEQSMYGHIEAWASFYASSYPSVGRIVGSYFDSRGCGTAELTRVYSVFKKLAEIKEAQKRQAINLPECNSEWNGDTKKGRVWCSKKSGGVERDWVGVPRIYTDEEDESQRCVCYNVDDHKMRLAKIHLRLYPDCPTEATECNLSE